MRVDPKLHVEVQRVGQPPAKGPAAPFNDLKLPLDHARLTRGAKTTLTWDKTKLTRPLGTDRLNLSEAARKSDLISDTEASLAEILAEMEARGLTDHPQYRKLSRLRQGLGRLADRNADRDALKLELGVLRHSTMRLWEAAMRWILSDGDRERRIQDRKEKGREQIRAGREEEAMFTYRYLLELDPEDAESHGQLGRLLLDRQRHAEAERHLQQAATSRPRDFQVQLALGELYYQLGETDLARHSFERASSLKERHSDPHAWLGVLAYEQGDLGSAIRSLDTAIALDPSNAVARFYLAQAALQLNDPLRANYQLAMVQRIEPAADLERFTTTRPTLPSATTERLQHHRWQAP